MIYTVNLISKDNGVGLYTDMNLLQDLLTEAGNSVERVSWQAKTMRKCDIAIFLELFNPRLMRCARRTVGIFNLEWFTPSWRPYLSRITQLWTKSQDAYDVLGRLGLRSHLTGFLSRGPLWPFD
ncbi:hypothetical protein ABZ667_43590 [Streptomyces lavendulae]|uniref:hypothetical protein n=1 Tax=Streptomyces lavendulae TaxID=1914 RepID=UPI0033D95C1B